MMNKTSSNIGQDLKELPDNRVIRLENVTCIYCGTPLEADTSSKEHVIGRRFVPKGKLQGNWNLIVNACQPCNGTKSSLEDDISAITLQPDVFGRHPHDDDGAKSDALRKAQGAFSRRTSKNVADSSEQIAVQMPFGPGINFTFTFTSPAQVNQRRVFQLARLQLMAFFYWITFDDSRKRGGWWPGGFHPLLEARLADWGNPVHRAFADAVVEWKPRVFASNADGFFKVALRKHPTANCWSWALEWNHAMRVIGFCGDEGAARAVAAGFPKLKAETVSKRPNGTLAYRTESPLPEGEDKLFYWDDGNG